MKTRVKSLFLFVFFCFLLSCAKNPQEHFDAGDTYFEQEMYSEAIDEYKKAIAIKPDWALAHNNLGLVYTKTNKQNLAIREYNEAIKCDPNLAEAYYNLASVYYDQRAFAKAISFYNKALEINPQMAEAHYNLGATYYETKRYDLARKEAMEAQKLGFDVKALLDALDSLPR